MRQLHRYSTFAVCSPLILPIQVKVMNIQHIVTDGQFVVLIEQIGGVYTRIHISEQIRDIGDTLLIRIAVNIRQVRKVTKTKGTFTSDMALMKLIYLAHNNIKKKWTMPLANWGTTAQKLAIWFPGRMVLDLQ